jgi:hypothetical protein
MYEKRLASKHRFRINDNKELVLQVLEEETWFDGLWKSEYIWRDAKVEDLTIMESAKLEDLTMHEYDE